MPTSIETELFGLTSEELDITIQLLEKLKEIRNAYVNKSDVDNHSLTSSEQSVSEVNKESAEAITSSHNSPVTDENLGGIETALSPPGASVSNEDAKDTEATSSLSDTLGTDEGTEETETTSVPPNQSPTAEDKSTDEPVPNNKDLQIAELTSKLEAQLEEINILKTMVESQKLSEDEKKITQARLTLANRTGYEKALCENLNWIIDIKRTFDTFSREKNLDFNRMKDIFDVCFEQAGIVFIPNNPVGLKFDSKIMDIYDREITNNKEEDEIVSSCIDEGYFKINGVVIRKQHVIVKVCEGE